MSVERCPLPHLSGFPVELADIVATMKVTNKPEYEIFELRDTERDHASTHNGSAGGLTFTVYTRHQDAYHERPRAVAHLFPVPAATYNRGGWLRWVLERLKDIESHELGEGFTVLTDGEGVERPFAPTHGPGDNPYVTVQYATDEQRRTSFLGTVKEEITHPVPVDMEEGL